MSGPRDPGQAPRATQRLDKWLWAARFFKTRTLAAKQVSEGHVRLGGERVLKPAQAVGAGDVLTFAQGRAVRVVEVAALSERRGPAPEARALYHDRSPAPVPRAGPRPTGRERRRLDAGRARGGERGHAHGHATGAPLDPPDGEG